MSMLSCIVHSSEKATHCMILHPLSLCLKLSIGFEVSRVRRPSDVLVLQLSILCNHLEGRSLKSYFNVVYFSV
jgi:hypothetical protein